MNSAKVYLGATNRQFHCFGGVGLVLGATRGFLTLALAWGWREEGLSCREWNWRPEAPDLLRAATWAASCW